MYFPRLMDVIGVNSTVWSEIVQEFKNKDTLMHISSTLVSVIGTAPRTSHLFYIVEEFHVHKKRRYVKYKEVLNKL